MGPQQLGETTRRHRPSVGRRSRPLRPRYRTATRAPAATAKTWRGWAAGWHWPPSTRPRRRCGGCGRHHHMRSRRLPRRGQIFDRDSVLMRSTCLARAPSSPLPASPSPSSASRLRPCRFLAIGGTYLGASSGRRRQRRGRSWRWPRLHDLRSLRVLW
ncbi:hypothetical protein K458DRAFT_189321 [Lentithecium fluviatile CBS 122367]|uniref:Uncharacterized protein n=1 Tax=Lentithecium fluviatile CBS 122367 TaxID=1168545 RepID=A0A6G1J9Y7_9PLEO|nr:hypothetical protein K458DRAFT_189321 [Lentithecium fluviatile CBS 122367]